MDEVVKGSHLCVLGAKEQTQPHGPEGREYRTGAACVDGIT